MNNLKRLFSAVIFANVFYVSSAHALVVDFEEYDAIGLLDVFLQGNINLDAANSTHRLINQSFGNGGISFSGGVLLQDPLNSQAMPIIGDGVDQSIYYGTAFSPSTSITTANYSNVLTIDIDSTRDEVTNVSGSFVHGLDTRAVGPNELVNYFVDYYVDGIADPFRENLGGQLFVDGASVISFNLDTNTLAGAAMGAFVNKVELKSAGFDFDSDNDDRTEIFEWDFLLSSVSFNESVSPVPLPAALPLFMSALLGGFVAARRKKSNDHKITC